MERGRQTYMLSFGILCHRPDSTHVKRSTSYSITVSRPPTEDQSDCLSLPLAVFSSFLLQQKCAQN